jgi:hypothetical protein
VADVPVGMNLELFHLLSALLSEHFLRSCGAVLPALADGGLSVSTVQQAGAALAYRCLEHPDASADMAPRGPAGSLVARTLV